MDAAIFLFNIIIKYITPSSIIKCSFTALYFYMQNKKTILMKELEETKKPSAISFLKILIKSIAFLLRSNFNIIERLDALEKKENMPILLSVSNSIPRPNIKNIPNAFSYNMEGNIKDNNLDLLTLCNSLIEGKYIDSATKNLEFRKIFTCTLPINKIIWIGTVSSLHYFVRQLHEKNKIVLLKKDIWSVTCNIFIKANNISFVKERFKGQKTPSSLDKITIDKAISHLLSSVKTY